MERNFPCPIVDDNDLSIYADYLNNDKCEDKKDEETTVCMRGISKRCARTPRYEMQIENSNTCLMPSNDNMPEMMVNSAFFPAYLRNHIGKLVKVESLIANCLETRIGTLMQVGADYIVIKLYQSCSTMVCDSCSIKYITIIHDNDMNKAGLF